MENWRPISGWEGLYEVSDLGRVRSVDRVSEHGLYGVAKYNGRIIKPVSNGVGHLFVRLYRRAAASKIYVHRAIAEAFLNTSGSWEVDHKDGDPSNNAMSNLRLCTRHQNMQNRKRDVDNKSGFKGVFRLPSGRFQAKITAHGNRHTVGTFDTPEAAAEAYASAARDLHGEFAREA